MLSGSSSSSTSNARAEHDLEREALALAAGQRLDLPVGALRVAAAERGVRAAVPHDLGAVAAGVLPRGERVRVRELRALAGVGGQPLLGRPAAGRGGLANLRLAVGEEELAHAWSAARPSR